MTNPNYDADRRFSGLSRLYGIEGARKIRASHVLVVGIGGVGSWAVEALARSGVGNLTLIDMDHISESNINRQIHATDATLGQAKVKAMSDRIYSINPSCVVNCVDEFVDAANWQSLLPLGVTAVIEACDQVSAKTWMAAWAQVAKSHFISVGAAGGKRQAHLVDIDDIAHVTHDPLLSQVRYRLRKEHFAKREGKKIGVTCVFSREAVSPPDASCSVAGDGSLNCHGYGSVVAVTATFGQCAAGWVIDKIASDVQSPEITL
jgi:tRNA A37 threonylcarbamoyladenosine dehydratase